MKRNILLPGLALALALALTGCSKSAESPAPSAPAVTPTQTAAPQSTPGAKAKGIERALDDMEADMEDMVRDGTVHSGAGGWAGSDWAPAPPPGN